MNHTDTGLFLWTRMKEKSIFQLRDSNLMFNVLSFLKDWTKSQNANTLKMLKTQIVIHFEAT